MADIKQNGDAARVSKHDGSNGYHAKAEDVDQVKVTLPTTQNSVNNLVYENGSNPSAYHSYKASGGYALSDGTGSLNKDQFVSKKKCCVAMGIMTVWCLLLSGVVVYLIVTQVKDSTRAPADKSPEPAPARQVSSDINECMINNGGCHGNCINTVGGFYCSCGTGLTLNPIAPVSCDADTLYCDSFYHVDAKLCYCKVNGDVVPLNGTLCTDLDECAINNGGCEHVCKNTFGSFECTCNSGHTLSDNGRSCNGGSSVAGPPGPPGATGSTGATGYMGSKGMIGATGPQGNMGATGFTGSTGSSGATGAPGIGGGLKGEKGDVGSTGATGLTGSKGEAGVGGSGYIKGEKGDIGATGMTGMTGAPGSKGDKGMLGATGFTGATGAPGSPSGR